MSVARDLVVIQGSSSGVSGDEAASSSRFKDTQGLDVLGVREHVKDFDLCGLIAASYDTSEISGEALRVAGHVDDRPRSGHKQSRKKSRSSRPRRVEDRQIIEVFAGLNFPSITADKAELKSFSKSGCLCVID